MQRTLLLGLLASSTSPVVAQRCISLSGSTTCPAFSASSVSTNSNLTGLYPFLAFVSSTADFDTRLTQYITTNYVATKYRDLLGCDDVSLSNTTNYYARYTTSAICNSIVQNSRTPCALPAAVARPLCADSCAEQAISEEKITTNQQLCRNPNANYIDQIRADFTNCALPADSLSGACVTGEQNEPQNCGFSTNLQGLCDYCRGSSVNATDSCCVGSNATGRCQDVTLPVFATLPPLFTSTTNGNPNPTAAGAGDPGAAAGSSHHGLTGGQIAGIVVGSILGFLLLLALLIAACLLLRRRTRAEKSSAANAIFQPPPRDRGSQQMTYGPPSSSQQGYEVLPGGRVARMSALQGSSAESQPQVGAVAGIHSRRYENSDSERYGDSPESSDKPRALVAGKRNGSLSGSSVLPTGTEDSPGSNGQYSSPEGVASAQSEQLPFFKDYYSSDEIHPNDKVSVLWAYQPRAGDEFELERGDMLKVVGIWDDGWATGVRINDRAEDYDGKHKEQRDSGVSNGSAAREPSPGPSGEIKAFPLVCVCLPEAWRKTVEGDGSTESGSGGPPGT